jgi:hypothetical protein
MKIKLYLNSDKVRQDQPDLIGKSSINGEACRIALWNQLTKAGDKDYYAGSIGQDAKDGVKTRIKLYEQRKAAPGNPDYGTPEPFELAGSHHYAYLTICPDPSGQEDLLFTLDLTDEPIGQEPTGEIAAFMERLEKYRKPAVATPQAALLSHRDDENPDEIPFKTTVYRGVKISRLNRTVM